MVKIRKSEERGHARHGWLDTYHTFSFANYYDPKHMGFRSLRVINDDRISPGRGFGAHGHRDMEILTYVIEGQLAHQDNMGQQKVLGPNEIQYMSAGTGVVHSEFNASKTDPVRLIQIWIEPAANDARPAYQQLAFDPEEKRGRLRLLASPDESNSGKAAVIRQDAKLYVAQLPSGTGVQQPLAKDRHAWVQVVQGNVAVNGQTLTEGDAAALSNEEALSLEGRGSEGGEVLVFDLA